MHDDPPQSYGSIKVAGRLGADGFGWRPQQKEPVMLHAKGANELGLASASILIQLMRRLIAQKTLKQETALALLGDAAEELEKQRPREGHRMAAKMIREEIVKLV
jgi:hypothetical protein